MGSEFSARGDDKTAVHDDDDISNLLAQDHIAPDGSMVIIVFRKIPEAAPGFFRFHFEEQVIPEVKDPIPLEFWREALAATPPFEQAMRKYDKIVEKIQTADKQKLLQGVRDGDTQIMEELKMLQYQLIFQKTVEKVHLGRELKVTLISPTGEESQQILL